MLLYRFEITKSTVAVPFALTVTDFCHDFGCVNTGRWTLRSVRTS